MFKNSVASVAFMNPNRSLMRFQMTITSLSIGELFATSTESAQIKIFVITNAAWRSRAAQIQRSRIGHLFRSIIDDCNPIQTSISKLCIENNKKIFKLTIFPILYSLHTAVTGSGPQRGSSQGTSNRYKKLFCSIDTPSYIGCRLVTDFAALKS